MSALRGMIGVKTYFRPHATPWDVLVHVLDTRETIDLIPQQPHLFYTLGKTIQGAPDKPEDDIVAEGRFKGSNFGVNEAGFDPRIPEWRMVGLRLGH